jgi:hypothetical protein
LVLLERAGVAGASESKRVSTTDAKAVEKREMRIRTSISAPRAEPGV